uniref:Uncharacterized protein n=1 Tax=Anguilla anguilla TaxID=7936 RepID=A0A0E9X4K9_ANGAN
MVTLVFTMSLFIVNCSYASIPPNSQSNKYDAHMRGRLCYEKQSSASRHKSIGFSKILDRYSNM